MSASQQDSLAVNPLHVEEAAEHALESANQQSGGGLASVVEQKRLAVLESYGVMDTPPDPFLDRITRLAALLLDTPVALVSLLDNQRQWFKSRHGLEVTETPRSVAFCDHVVRDREELIVEDASVDPRFCSNPLVISEPNVRFYIGVPLFGAEGAALGTLCAIDYVPRRISSGKIDKLRELAALATERLNAIKLEADYRKARADLALKSAISALISDAQGRFIKDAVASAGWWGSVLEELLALTDSEYGFIGLVGDDEQGRFLRTKAITNIAWNEETQRLYEENRAKGLVFRNLNTLFGRPLVTQKRFIANDTDPATNPNARGRPAGHPPLTCFAGLPIMNLGTGRMVGLIGLANRPGGYSDEQLDQFEPVLTCLATVLQNSELLEERLSALRKAEAAERLQQHVLESSASGCVALRGDGTVALANARARQLLPGLEDIERQSPALGLRTSVATLFDDATRDRVLSLYADSTRTSIGPFDVSVSSEQGAARLVEVVATRFAAGLEEPPDGVMLTLTDVQQRAQLQRTLTEKAGLEERLRVTQQNQRDNEVLAECVEYLQNCVTVEEGLKLIAVYLDRLFTYGDVALYQKHEQRDFFVLRHAITRSDGHAPADEITTQQCWALRSHRVYGSGPAIRRLPCHHAADLVTTEVFCVPLFSLDRTIALFTVTHAEQCDDVSEAIVNAKMSQLSAMARTLSGALSTIALRESLQRMALTDELTGISNRRAFEMEARRILERCRRAKRSFAVIVFDVDHFKRVNDTFGHHEGDRVLSRVAAEIQRGARSSDLVARIGGEELAVFLAEVTPEQVMRRAQAILDRVRDAVVIGAQPVTLSAGVAHAEDLELNEGLEDLLRKADTALYSAKRAGRDRIAMVAAGGLTASVPDGASSTTERSRGESNDRADTAEGVGFGVRHH